MHTSIDAVYVFPPPHTLSQTHTYVIKQRHSYEYTHMLRRSCDEGAEMSLVVSVAMCRADSLVSKIQITAAHASLSLSLSPYHSLTVSQADTHSHVYISQMYIFMTFLNIMRKVTLSQLLITLVQEA